MRSATTNAPPPYSCTRVRTLNPDGVTSLDGRRRRRARARCGRRRSAALEPIHIVAIDGDAAEAYALRSHHVRGDRRRPRTRTVFARQQLYNLAHTDVEAGLDPTLTERRVFRPA